MAVAAIPNYNRIIDLTFLCKKTRVIKGLGKTDVMEKVFEIKCPRRGQKPTIEINGTFAGGNYLPAFNITVKNLYLDLMGQQYTHIRVTAGYEGETIDLEGTVFSLFQESPGPDGNTVIQCIQGNLGDWLSTYVDVNYKRGRSLGLILDSLYKDLGLKNRRAGPAASVLTLREGIMYNGKASGLIERLCQMFSDVKLAVTVRDQVLCAVAIAKGDSLDPKMLKYLNAPPQANVGDESGTCYTTINAPWQPDIRMFDRLKFSARQYIRFGQTVGTDAKEQTICVTALSFQFSTTGGANSMTVQGYKV